MSKWKCEHCGKELTLEEANKFYNEDKIEFCSKSCQEKWKGTEE
jgi:endogenous inhibitor of DNA gyrase (YacG/DUF329 family)